MKSHTSEFKEEIKTLGKQQSVRITYKENNVTKTLTNEDINSATPNYEASLLKSVMKVLELDSNVSIPKGTEIKFEYGLLVNGAYEYLNHGNYIVAKEPEKQEDTLSYKITCYDKMLYSMKDYEHIEVDYPCKIKKFLIELCKKIGLEFKDSTFANQDREFASELFMTINEDGTYSSMGYTYRDVLDQIAETTGGCICMTLDDKVEVRYINKALEYSTSKNTNEIEIETQVKEKVKTINIDGNSYQGENPSPYNPQEITNVGGYDNLFDKNNIISGSYVSDSNGAFVSNSTSKRTDYIEIQANSYYHIYSDKTTGNWGAWYDKDKKFISGITLGGQKEGTVNSPTNAKYIAFTISYQGNLTDYSKIKINETAIKIKQSGKNLLNTMSYTTETKNGVTATRQNDGSIKVVGTATADTQFDIVLFTPSSKEKIYFLSGCPKGGSISTYYLNLNVYGKNDVGNGVSFTNTINPTYVRIKVLNGVSIDTVFMPMIVEGTYSEATLPEYEPYHEPIITPINLQGNILSKVGDVKDILKVNRNGEVEIKKNTWEETINTSSLITLSNNNKGLVFYTSKKKTTSYSDNDYLVTNAQRNRTFNDGTVYQNSSNFVFVGSPTDTLETIKAKFNGGKILYQLATPQTIQLPSISPIELWQGTNIFSLVTNLDTEIELEYPTNYDTIDEEYINDTNVNFGEKYRAY